MKAGSIARRGAAMDVAVGGPGESVAAWLDPATGQLVAAASREGRWSEAQAIQGVTGFGGGEVVAVRTAMTSDGTAVVAWVTDRERKSTGGSKTSSLHVASLSRDAARWSEPLTFARGAAAEIAFPQLCADARGVALLVWAHGARTLESQWCAATGWSEPCAIEGVKAGAELAMNSRGEGVLVWAQPSQVEDIPCWLLQAKRRSASGEWGGAAEIARSYGFVRSLHAGIDELGCAAVQWVGGPVFNARLLCARESAPGKWGRQESHQDAYRDPEAMVVHGALAAGGDGVVALAWSEDNPLPGRRLLHVRIESHEAPPVERTWYTDDEADPARTNLAMSRDGSMVVLSWSVPGEGRTNAIVWRRGAGWSEQVVLGGAAQGGYVDVACGGGGGGAVPVAAAIWPGSGGSGFLATMAANGWETLTPAPPASSAPQPELLL